MPEWSSWEGLSALETPSRAPARDFHEHSGPRFGNTPQRGAHTSQ